MTTVVNNPAPSSNEGSGMGMIIGIIVLVVVLFFVFFYGMPYFRGTASQNNAPQPDSAIIEVPDQIDVNVNKAP